MNFAIEFLDDHPSFVPTLAAWHNAQWSYLDRSVPVEQRTAALQRHRRHQIPSTVVAVSGDTLLGSASLIAHDMDTRMEWSPWLASVYVSPQYRRQGIGSALVRRIVEETRALGYRELYLFTPDQERLYARLGWQVIERTIYRGYAQVVMVLRLPVEREPPGK